MAELNNLKTVLGRQIQDLSEMLNKLVNSNVDLNMLQYKPKDFSSSLLSDSNHFNKVYKSKTDIVCQINDSYKKNILILADKQGQSMSLKLRNLLGASYNVQAVTKPNAMYTAVVVSDAHNLARSFSRQDYVFILAGTNDVVRGSIFDVKAIDKLMLSLSHTNVVFLTVPKSYKGFRYDDAILYFNENLYKYYLSCRDSQSFLYLDINYLFDRICSPRNSIYMSNDEKSRVANAMAQLINYDKHRMDAVNGDNLVYIDLTDTDSESDKSLYINYDNLKYVHVTSVLDEQYHCS